MVTGTKLNDSLISGIAGAVAVTAVHQAALKMTDAAPRMDVLGVRALAKGARRMDLADASRDDVDRAAGGTLYNAALAGDLFVNSVYYSMATTWTRGAALGLLAGICCLTVPQKVGLGEPPRSELLSNKIMTVAWYVIGGLAAAWTAQCLAAKRGEARRDLAVGF